MNWVWGLSLALVGCGSASGPAAPVTGIRAHTPSKLQEAPGRSYTVQAGDTLYRIALDQDVTVEDVVAWNGLNDGNRIYPGRRLRLEAPAAPIRRIGLAPAHRDAPLSQAGPADKARPDTARAISARAVPAKFSPSPDAVLPQGWDWPASGEVLTRFDPGAGNKGIDIVAAEGAPIRAAASGQVAYAGEGPRGYGMIVIIKHDAARLSVYAHQSRILVNEGQRVPRGAVIGEMGRSGSRRVKLHFEIREHGKPVDPARFLPTT